MPLCKILFLTLGFNHLYYVISSCPSNVAAILPRRGGLSCTFAQNTVAMDDSELEQVTACHFLISTQHANARLRSAKLVSSSSSRRVAAVVVADVKVAAAAAHKTKSKRNSTFFFPRSHDEGPAVLEVEANAWCAA